MLEVVGTSKNNANHVPTTPMPEQKTEAKLQRCLLLLDALRRLSGPSGRWVKVSELVKDLEGQGYRVKEHSIRRDLSVLLGTLPQLECNDNRHGDGPPRSGLPYGYRWAGKDAPPATGLTLAEAVSLELVRRYLQQALPATLTHALQDLFAKAQEGLHNRR